jgi:hypothetical protein
VVCESLDLVRLLKEFNSHLEIFETSLGHEILVSQMTKRFFSLIFLRFCVTKIISSYFTL